MNLKCSTISAFDRLNTGPKNLQSLEKFGMMTVIVARHKLLN